MTSTKADLTNNLHAQCGLPKNMSTYLLEEMLEMIKKTLVNGEGVLIFGFGKFCVKEKSGRRGRNPYTGEDLSLAERRVVTFKCSQGLKERINGKD